MTDVVDFLKKKNITTSEEDLLETIFISPHSRRGALPEHFYLKIYLCFGDQPENFPQQPILEEFRNEQKKKYKLV